MPCNTPECSKVYAVVKKWMELHAEVSGSWMWDAFDEQSGLDITISVHVPRCYRLVLRDQQVAPTLTAEVEARIADWLNNLPVSTHI